MRLNPALQNRFLATWVTPFSAPLKRHFGEGKLCPLWDREPIKQDDLCS